MYLNLLEESTSPLLHRTLLGCCILVKAYVPKCEPQKTSPYECSLAKSTKTSDFHGRFPSNHEDLTMFWESPGVERTAWRRGRRGSLLFHRFPLDDPKVHRPRPGQGDSIDGFLVEVYNIGRWLSSTCSVLPRSIAPVSTREDGVAQHGWGRNAA